MNAGRTVGAMGIAIGLASAIAIGASPGTRPVDPRVGQDQHSTLKPVVYRSLRNDVSPRLDAIKPIAPAPRDANRVRINKQLPSRLKMARQAVTAFEDPVVQKEHGQLLMPSPIANFDGIDNVNGVLPPDTQGDIGPNHYVQWVNLSFAIFAKDGTKVYPAVGFANGNTLWSGFGGACETSNDGDPVTLYDTMAGRWLMTQFALPNYPDGPFYECLAISTSSDPTGTWNRYVWQVPVDKMDDYPKLGVWPDGYYMTVNQFAGGTGSWAGAGVVAFERSKMVNGLPAQAVYFDLYGVDPNLGGMLPSDLDGATPPPAGTPNFVLQFNDDGWGYPSDQLALFKFHVDWTTISNSTFTGPTIIDLTALGYPFDANLCSGAGGCIPQPGTGQGLDAISDRLMHRLAYRNFGDHESLVVNHTVDANGSDHAGIRWYELRSPNGTPTVYQAGTYAPDVNHRWMGSISMDAVGNIALGYSASGTNLYPSVRYAGRLAGDPLGTLPQAEVTLMAGGGSQMDSSARWGDYSMLGTDPTDDCTFWYTQEYIQETSGGAWRTRIGSFRFPSCTAGPTGILTGTVTDSSSGLPIQNALVQAGGAIETQTAANGTYSFLTMPIGTYDVTFSKPGYAPQTFSSVSVTAGNTTTRDAALVAMPPATVSGVVRDGSGHNWPLYARIDVAGIPSKTTYANPATGEYSISLWAGATYNLTATSLVPGYLTGNASATPSGSPAAATANFYLAIDAVTCTAPGYAPTTGFSADFESTDGGFVAAGTFSSWAWGTPTSGPGSAHSGTKVWATNLSSFYNTWENSTLTSPVIDLSAYAGQAPSIRWWQWLMTETDWDFASIEVSKNGGSTWTTVYGPISGEIDSVWNKHTVALDSSYSVANFRLRFRLTSDEVFEYFGWYIDDVAVTFGCVPAPGGLIVGKVTDANTGAPLVGATVTGVAHPADTATSVATPDDPDLPDGIYRLFSSATGSLAFDGARAGGYGTERHTVAVMSNEVVTQDFHLPAGRFTGLPASMTVDVPLGTTTTREFTLTNNGGLSAAYSLVPPPLAAGSVVQSWFSGEFSPWGIAFDGFDDTVWVSSPSWSWFGESRLDEYSRTGVPTGRYHDYTWAPAEGPADAAFNWTSGNIWVMNVAAAGGANCIFEINPGTGPTGSTICPGGGTGFAISQHAIAYDPTTASWYAGGWNNQTIYHFSSAGTILDSKPVGIAISGMAYNPDTHHLFVIVQADPTLVHVYNTGDNYSLVKSFSIPGFGPYTGTGLEIGCDGHLWANNADDWLTYEFGSGETASICQVHNPWHSVTPASGALAPAASQVFTVTFDATASTGITEPGEHKGEITIFSATPYGGLSFPITMNVTAAPPSVSSLNANRTSPFTIDGVTAITWTAATSGGVAPLQYQFWRYNVGLSAYTLVQDYSASNTYAWTPIAGQQGTHFIRVYVRSSGTAAGYDAVAYSTYFTVVNVTPPSVTSVLADRASPMVANGTNTVTWTATTTGGAAPLQFQFWRRDNGTATYTLAQDYSTSHTYAWTPAAGTSGSYLVRVYVRNNGTTVGYDAVGYSPSLTLLGTAPPSVTSVLPDRASPMVGNSSNTVTWTVTTTGGSAPLTYQVWRYNVALASYTLVQDYSANNTYEWTPAAADQGTYSLRVYVRNNGTTSGYDAVGYAVYFTIAASAPPTVTSIQPDRASPMVGDGVNTVTWTAAATGGVAPLQYQFWLRNNGTGIYSLLQDYGTSNVASWAPPPGSAGTYLVRVYVRNNGTTSGSDAVGYSAWFVIQ